MLKKLSLILVILLSFSSHVIAEVWTWIDYEMYCFKNNIQPEYEVFLKIPEGICLEDDESVILNLFEGEEEGEE